MQRILPGDAALPLHGVQASRAIERQLQTPLPPHTLMQRAGDAVARLALAWAPHARKVWVVAGPGNNGGDGFDAALRLRAAGKDATVCWVGREDQAPDDARDALQRARAAGVPITTDLAAPRLDAHDLAIDALLGIGASRAPGGRLAAAVEQLNALRCPVLAVDLPSGLDADTGHALGAVVQATVTLTLLTVKPGLFTGVGRDHSGEVWFDALGAPSDAASADAWLTGRDTGRGAARRHVQHKGSFGDVALVGGAPGMGGAIVLAARAALAAGAGRVYVDALDEGGHLDASRPELMWRRRWSDSDPAVLQRTTVVAGCGGGDAVGPVLNRLANHVERLVLDADALNALASDRTLKTVLRLRASRGRLTVLTPHPLEAARLLDGTIADVQANRPRAAQTLAQQLQCVVVLKGSGSLVASPEATLYVNPTGSAALASPGTGDVLAGWIGGLWAQAGGLAASDLPALVARAVREHGAVADQSGARVLRAGDLVEHLHAFATTA